MAHALRYVDIEGFAAFEEAKQYTADMRMKNDYCVWFDRVEDEYIVLTYERQHSYGTYELPDYIDCIQDTREISSDNLADIYAKLSELFREYSSEDYIAYQIRYLRYFNEYILEWEIFRKVEWTDKHENDIRYNGDSVQDE